MLEINKSVSAAKDVKPNVNDDAASAISREEIAAILTVKQGSLSYDGAAIEYYNFIIRHKQAVKFVKDPSTKLSILLDSLTGRAAMIVGGCSLLGDDGYLGGTRSSRASIRQQGKDLWTNRKGSN